MSSFLRELFILIDWEDGKSLVCPISKIVAPKKDAGEYCIGDRVLAKRPRLGNKHGVISAIHEDRAWLKSLKSEVDTPRTAPNVHGVQLSNMRKSRESSTEKQPISTKSKTVLSPALKASTAVSSISPPEKPASQLESSISFSKKPVGQTEASISSSKKPAVQTEASISSSKKPAVQMEASIYSSRKPAVQTEASISSSKKPAVQTEASIYSSKKSAAQTESSIYSSKKPAGQTEGSIFPEKPAAQTEASISLSKKPAGQTKSPPEKTAGQTVSSGIPSEKPAGQSVSSISSLKTPSETPARRKRRDSSNLSSASNGSPPKKLCAGVTASGPPTPSPLGRFSEPVEKNVRESELLSETLVKTSSCENSPTSLEPAKLKKSVSETSEESHDVAGFVSMKEFKNLQREFEDLKYQLRAMKQMYEKLEGATSGEERKCNGYTRAELKKTVHDPDSQNAVRESFCSPMDLSGRQLNNVHNAHDSNTPGHKSFSGITPYRESGHTDIYTPARTPVNTCDSCCSMLKTSIKEFTEDVENLKRKMSSRSRYKLHSSKEVERFNGKTKEELMHLATSMSSLTEAVKSILLALFSVKELSTCSLKGKHTNKFYNQRSGLDEQKRNIAEAVLIETFKVGVNVVRMKIRDRLKLIRKSCTSIQASKKWFARRPPVVS